MIHLSLWAYFQFTNQSDGMLLFKTVLMQLFLSGFCIICVWKYCLSYSRQLAIQNKISRSKYLIMSFYLYLLTGRRNKIHQLICLISFSIMIFDYWNISHFKGYIHRFLLSTKTFLYDFNEPRYTASQPEEKRETWDSSLGYIFG